MLQARDEAQLSTRFGLLITRLREDDARGLTQRGAAKLLGVSHTRLRSLESGIHHVTGLPTLPSPDLTVRLAALYRVPKQEMLLHAGYVPWLLDEANISRVIEVLSRQASS